jgi:GxxExxY protein
MNFEEEPRMNTDERGLKFDKETRSVISCAFEVLNTLGHGLLEKPYENALCVEFSLRDIPWLQQPRYDVLYKTVKVGEYIPDLIVYGFVVVDTKVIDRITDHELGQMLNYLKITGHPVGLILNFKRGRLEWKRVINDTNPEITNHG